MQIFSSSFFSVGTPWRWPILVEARVRHTNTCTYRNVCCVGAIYRLYTSNVHITCSNKTSWVSKHHFLRFLIKVWRCASTCHSCLVTQRSDTGMFCMKLAIRLLYEWRNGWSMGCGAARGYNCSSSCDVTCLHVCTLCVCVFVYTHNRSEHLHNTHDTTPFTRNSRMLYIIEQSLLETAERATSYWLYFDTCH